jgi:thiol-disulfide isomerase/thioredoxin
MKVLLVTVALFLSMSQRVEARSEPMSQVTLYAFFATWCVPCRLELPFVDRMRGIYGELGLDVVLVSEDAPSSAMNIPTFLARYGVESRWILDNESELLSRYNPAGNLPFVVILNRDGSVAYAHAGYEPGDEKLLEAAIKRALGNSRETRRPRVRSLTQGLGIWRESRFDDVPQNDGRLRAAVGRLEVSGGNDTAAASLRVDGALVDDAVAGPMDRERDARLERALVDVRIDRFRLRAGDDYAAFGNGVSLSLRRIDTLGQDTSLRGGRVDVALGTVAVKALAGLTNPQNLDPVNLEIVDEKQDFIAGTEVSIVGRGLRLAPYMLYAKAEEASPAGLDIDWLLGGLSGAAKLERIRLAAEVAAGQRQGLGVRDETAIAAYGSTQIELGPATLLAEGKYYRHWELGRPQASLLYHEPPSLEREDQEVPSNSNAVGGRVRAEFRLPRETAVFANALAYRYTQDERDPLAGDYALHGYAGLERRFGDSASAALQLGYRDENDADGGDKLSLWHVDADAAVRLGSSVALTLKWNHREESKELFNRLDFRRGLALAGVSWTGVGTASFLYGYSTEQVTTPTHYPAGEVLIHLPKGGSLRLFGGRLTGGRVCVSGSCRDVPPFEGLRLDLIFKAEL